MKNELRIQDRLTEPWAIRPAALHAFLAMDDEREDDMADPVEHGMTIESGIAIIPLVGVMMKNPDEIDRMCGACSTTEFTRNVLNAMADTNVKAIVLDVDSPGGQVSGVDEAHAAVRAAAAVKPVVNYTGALECSAALWACCGASVSYCSRMAIVGSIGCYSLIGDTSKYYESAGIKMHLIKSGKNKGDGAFGTPVPESMLKRMQGLVDQIGGMFRADVKAARPGVADETMEGQEFLGADCIGVGLVDSVTSFDRAVADAGALAAMR